MVRIDSMDFGEVAIDGKTQYSDVVVWWDGQIDAIPKFYIFGIRKLIKLLDREPEVVVIGTGIEGSVRISRKVEDYSEMQGLKLFVEKSRDAIEIFNAFVADNKKAVIILRVMG